MIGGLVKVVARAAAGVRRRVGATAATTLAVAMALVVFAAALWAADNLARWTASWRHGVDMIVFLDRDAGEDRAEDVAAAIAELDAVDSAHVVGARESLERLRRELGEDITDGVQATELPPSIEVSLSPGVRAVALAHPIVDRLLATDGVADVELAADWVDDVATVAHGLTRAAQIGMGLALLSTLYLVFVTLRLRALPARSAARVYSVLAAPSSFVRGPLIVEGMVHGALGAVLAIATVHIMSSLVSAPIEHLAQAIFGSGARVVSLSAPRMLALVGLGCASGAVGAALAAAAMERGGHRDAGG